MGDINVILFGIVVGYTFGMFLFLRLIDYLERRENRKWLERRGEK